MKPMNEAWFIQIELTTYCGKGCIYCSRYDRHIRKDQRMHMSLDVLEEALESLWEFPGKIGIIGGEPTLHPKFREVCEMIRSTYPAYHTGLWTAGGKLYEQYYNEGIIEKTFGMIAYNEHNEQQKSVCRHQPLTVAIKDVVPDSELRAKLIDDCWVQRNWCPSVAPWGKTYFCEVAYSLALIQDDHDKGYELTEDWWKRTPEEFKGQVDRYCELCGMAIPMPRQKLQDKKELVSSSVLKLLREHNLPRTGDDWVELFRRQFTIEELRENSKDWYPGNYREDKKPDAVGSEGKGSTWLK